MTARTDFLAALTSAGYTPSRAVTFEEGSGTPVEHYTTTALGVSGTPTWATDTTYGPSALMDATGDNFSIPSSNTWLGTAAQTVLVIRRKTDATLRASFAFAMNTASNVCRCSTHLPYSDGKVYWDFGGIAGNNRVTHTSYVPTTDIEAWAFKAGPSGSKIWKDGVQVAGHSNAISRTADGGVTNINGGFGAGGDLQEFYFIAFISAEVSDAVLATFTVANVLLGVPSAPAITTTSPLPDGTKSEVYSYTFAATDGTPPYSWAIVSGAPLGLSMAASTGVVSGTIAAAGLYHLVVSITDANDVTVQETFDLYIDDPLCTAESIASLARGAFTNNSRVIHLSTSKRVALILRDADNPKQLNAQYSTNNGISWTSVRAAALVNNIIAHDSHHTEGSAIVHVWTQESTGRVAYHRFDMGAGLWTIEDEVVSAANAVISGGVTGTVLSPSGEAALVYESTKQNVGGSDRRRLTYARRTAGVWTPVIPMGDIGAAQSNNLGRLVAGASNRATLIMTIDPGYSVLSTPDFQMQVIRSDGTLSAISVFRSTGLLGTNPNFFAGNPTSYTFGSDLILVVPVKFGGEPTIFSFVDSDTPAGASLGEPVLDYFVGEGAFVPIVARFVQNELHTVDFGWDSLGGSSFLRHKFASSHLGPFSPFAMSDQTGPQMGAITSTTQTADADFAVRTCQNVDSLYVATVVPIGTIDSVTETVKFEWIKVSLLPTSSSLTLAQWLTDLETQAIEYCCTETPTVGICECEDHPGRIYRMAPDIYTDDNCTIRRLRRATHISEEQARMIHHLLQVDVEAGQGLTTGQGSDPQVMLRFSDDGGITWSNERWESAGAKGEFRKRVMFWRLGQSRDRVYELVVTDPVKWAIVSGYLDVSAGFK